MTECRFYPECSHLLDVGDSWFPCTGGADGTRCSEYSPIPYAEALLKLADELEAEGLDGWASGPVDVGRYAHRIREIVGEDVHGPGAR